jgi:hypothetical protein
MRRETKYDKAARIMRAEPSRVLTIARQGEDYWLGVVVGDHGSYKVAAVSPEHAERLGHAPDQRLHCPCRAGRSGKLCSHVIIAEAMRLDG